MPRLPTSRMIPRTELGLWLASWLAGGLNTIMTRACSMQVLGRTHHQRRLAGERVRCIYAAWHAYLWHGVGPLRRSGTWVMVSTHRDGEIIAKMLRRRGFRPIRGSSTRGGASALREMTRAAQTSETDVVMTIDGPRGPAREAKPGALFLARATGIPIVPMGLWVERAWQLPSWDRMVIGKPFSRLAVSFGRPMDIPQHATREEINGPLRERLEHALFAEENRARQAIEVR